MTTRIFQTYEDFMKREHEDINGVTPGFAAKNVNYEAMNDSNIACWNCKDCEDTFDSRSCVRCYSCCSCVGCSDCEDCYKSTGCSKCEGLEHAFNLYHVTRGLTS